MGKLPAFLCGILELWKQKNRRDIMLYEEPKPTPIKPLLTDMVKSLVEYPEYVDIHVIKKGRSVVYSIDVVPDDRGKIIGRKGCILESMQTLFYALGCKQGKNVQLVIHE